MSEDEYDKHGINITEIQRQAFIEANKKMNNKEIADYLRANLRINITSNLDRIRIAILLKDEELDHDWFDYQDIISME